MATFLKIIALIVKYGPTIWKIVQEIIDLINGVAEFFPKSEAIMFKQAKKQELHDAVTYYRVTKDKSKLETMHGELTCQLANFQNHSR